MIQVKANSNIVRESYNISIQNCIPRPVPGAFYRPKAKKVRKPWSFPESVFRDYVPDSDALIGRCFEEDWTHISKPKLKEDQMAKCRVLLKQNYRVMYQACTNIG